MFYLGGIAQPKNFFESSPVLVVSIMNCLLQIFYFQNCFVRPHTYTHPCTGPPIPLAQSQPSPLLSAEVPL